MAINPDLNQSKRRREKHPNEENGHSKDEKTPKSEKGKTKDISLDIAAEPEARDDCGDDGSMERLLRVALVVLTGIKVIFSRLLFIFHTLLTVWRTADVLGPHYWFLLLGLVALIVEAVLKLVTKKGVESKWFCPSVFLYLCTVVPAIWLLELDRLSSRQSVATNVTAQNNNNSNNINNNQTTMGLSSIEGIEIPIALSRDMWVLAIEQTLLFLLIIGRWMLPKGNITRDQLSQLLFVYIGIASDISEIFVLFEEKFVIDRQSLIYIILTAWTLSLMQYTLVLTATKSRKTRVAHAQQEDGDVESAGENERGGLFAWLCCACCETETWAILTTILLQDGPFLCIRLYVMIASMSLTYTILFYTFKNMLVLVLQIYRLVVINCDPSKGDEGDETSESPNNSPSQSSPTPIEGPSKKKPPKQPHEKNSVENPKKDQDGKSDGSRDYRRKSRAPKNTAE